MVGAPDQVFVDLRDATEKAKIGAIEGAIASSRRMIEFHIVLNVLLMSQSSIKINLMCFIAPPEGVLLWQWWHLWIWGDRPF